MTICVIPVDGIITVTFSIPISIVLCVKRHYDLD